MKPTTKWGEKMTPTWEFKLCAKIKYPVYKGTHKFSDGKQIKKHKPSFAG